MRWTKEMDDYFREIVPGNHWKDIHDLFQAKYGISLTESAIKARKSKLGVKSYTRGGQFQKGCIPHNKGKSWEEQGWSEESKAKARKTCFKPGATPQNGLDIPLGTEREGKDGYLFVKVRFKSSKPGKNDCWRPKASVMWEKYHGRELPKTHYIVFANHDIYDFSEDNLVAVDRRYAVQLNKQKVDYYDKDSLLACVAIVRLRMKRYELETNERECQACGVVFKPEYPHQRRCRECIDHNVPAKRVRRKRAPN